MRKSVAVTVTLMMIPLYILAVTGLPDNFQKVTDSNGSGEGFTDRVGFSSTVGFGLTRTYYFGLVRLPVYKAGINLHGLNQVFLPLTLLIAAGIWKKDTLKDYMF